MEPLPEEWMERIFLRLKEIYKQRFDDYYGKIEKNSCKYIMWSNALAGLDAKEIKQAINVCAQFPLSSVPTPIEFYHFSKGIAYPYQCLIDRRLAPNYENSKHQINNLLNHLKGKKQGSTGNIRHEY